MLQLFTNPFLITSLSGWVIAQIMKVIIYSIIDKKINLKRIFSAGGMPSAHTATVVSMASICGIQIGFHSYEFAFAMILTIIVWHDAMGVRMETQKQNVIIKKFLDEPAFTPDEELRNIKLKNSVGHTLPQILAGAVVGVLTALLMNYLLF